ncbi:hypothetical protein F5B20DRAFT_550518 [Whalleya microplaca]|nr:hypothetical protein F5B20DRAFT_550518 [Whalleya microplaca]
MQLKATILSVAALLFAGQAMGAALTAVDAVSACNCPNNCSHKVGSSCKYLAGPSTSSSVISGKCGEQNGQLTCIPK